MKKTVTMPTKSYLKEHKELVKTLRTGKGLKKEAKDQASEIKRSLGVII